MRNLSGEKHIKFSEGYGPLATTLPPLLRFMDHGKPHCTSKEKKVLGSVIF